MTAEFLKQGIEIYDSYLDYFEKICIDELQEKSFEIDLIRSNRWASSLQSRAFTVFWEKKDSIGKNWLKQAEEYFFEVRWYGLSYLLSRMDDTMDYSVQTNLEALPASLQSKLRSPAAFLRRDAARECYQLAIAPLAEKQRVKFLERIAEMEAALAEPILYQLDLELSEQSEKHLLEFAGKHRTEHGASDLEGFTYVFNGREYTDVQTFCKEDARKLSHCVFLRRDLYGSGVLQTFSSFPTFDFSDREWGGEELEFLFFDGKEVHLVVMCGGYRIASLTFYEHLLSADAGMKPYFEKLGWPADGIEWK